MKLLMLLRRDYKAFCHDGRVRKMICLFQDQGYDVSIAIYSAFEEDEHYETDTKLMYSRIGSGKSFLRELNPFSNEYKGLSSMNLIEKIGSLVLRYLYFEPTYFAKTVKIASEMKYDYIYCNDYETLQIGVLGKYHSNARLIYDAHELWCECNFLVGKKRYVKVFINRISAFVERFLMKFVDVFLTVSESIMEYYEHKYPMPARRQVIRNIPLFHEDNRNQGFLRSALSLSKEDKIVLYLGSLTVGRGIEALIKAWESVADQSIKLVFVGYGSQAASIQTLCNKENLHGRVFFKEAVPVEDVVKYASDADLGVCMIEDMCLSYRYSLPNKIFEYIVAGVPFIANKLPEFINLKNQNLGYVIEDESSVSIANKIQWILSSDNATEHLLKTQTCIARANNDLNWEYEAKRIFDIL